jgi:hypothetical protein
MIDKKLLTVGTTVYDKQSRWFEYDYHPQIIEKVDKTSIVVREEDKLIEVPIKNLYLENNLIIH